MTGTLRALPVVAPTQNVFASRTAGSGIIKTRGWYPLLNTCHLLANKGLSVSNKSGLRFDHKQRWVKIKKQLVFVSETGDQEPDPSPASTEDENGEEVEEEEKEGDEGQQSENHPTQAIKTAAGLPSTPVSQRSSRLDAVTRSSTRDDHSQSPTQHRHLSSHTTPAGFPFQGVSTSSERRVDFSTGESAPLTRTESYRYGDTNLPPNETTLISDTPTSNADSVAYNKQPQWPLHDAQEAMLFRYFIEHLAPLFDMCDDEAHFAKTVPRRAVFCLPLMNAMFAASAKRLSRLSGFDAAVSDRYHQKCLDVLIPALSDFAAGLDENLLAAVVILRFMEELDVSMVTTGSGSHLIGTRAFVVAQDGKASLTGVWGAAYRLALRQEIFTALVHGRPVHSNFGLDKIDQPILPHDSGCSFANLLVIHCGLCITACYGGPEAQMTLEAWEELKRSQDRAWETRPWIFYPMYTDGSTLPFPDERYLNDAVVTGVQHYYLGQILLAAYDPRIPKVGPLRRSAVREKDTQIKGLVRLLCGIAESNPQTAPAYVSACVAINMAGDRFKQIQEQEALYQILVKTDTTLAWPTQAVQTHMRDAWGWSP